MLMFQIINNLIARDATQKEIETRCRVKVRYISSSQPMSISHIISLFLLHPNTFSAEIKNLKQRIMLQNNDNIDLSSDLAEAEEKMKKMQQDNSLRLKTLENIVSEKDQEIQSLKSKIDRIKNQTEERDHSKAIDIFEEEKGDNAQ